MGDSGFGHWYQAFTQINFPTDFGELHRRVVAALTDRHFAQIFQCITQRAMGFGLKQFRS